MGTSNRFNLSSEACCYHSYAARQRREGGVGDVEALHKWRQYSHTLQQMTILVVVCSYLHIVTFLAVCMFLNFNVMNFKRKSFKFFVKGCREER